MPARSSTTRISLVSVLTGLGRLTLGGTVLLLALNLGACGNKGPLYLPEDPAGSTAQQANEAEQDERDR